MEFGAIAETYECLIIFLSEELIVHSFRTGPTVIAIVGEPKTSHELGQPKLIWVHETSILQKIRLLTQPTAAALGRLAIS